MLQRHALSGDREGSREAARAARARGRLPGGADLLRADARQLRLRRGGRPAGAPLRPGLRRARRDRDPFRVVRRDGPRRLPAPRRAGAGRPARRRGGGGGAARARAQRAAGRRPRRGGRRRVLPAPGDLPPDLPRAALAQGRRPPAAPPAPGEGHRPRRAAGCRDVLRLRRDVRGEERRHVGGDAHGQDAGGARHARGDLHGAGQLVPPAHRRRALPCAGRDAHGAPGRDPRLDGGGVSDKGFPAAAREALANTQQRRNLGHATRTIRAKRAGVVGEVADWEALRDAGAAIKASAMARLPELLEQLEASVQAAGGQVHWARDGAEANAILTGIVRSHGATEVVKVKSLASDEIEMNEALAAEGITAQETDLAELIIQLGDDEQSHILVPAIHRNRAEIRELFRRTLDDAGDLSDDPAELAEPARRHLRKRFLSARVGVSGANFAVADTGTICVVESEGNGRMCTTLPDVLVTVMGIEKVVPAFEDLEVMLQLLPRSSTGERMNPYTSLWTGTIDGDGPSEFHLILLDGGRTDVLADPHGRDALHCIRCSACLNVCPVYERTGGHAYDSVI